MLKKIIPKRHKTWDVDFLTNFKKYFIYLFQNLRSRYLQLFTQIKINKKNKKSFSRLLKDVWYVNS